MLAARSEDGAEKNGDIDAIELLKTSPIAPRSSNGFCEVEACPSMQDSAAATLALTQTVVEVIGTMLVVGIFYYWRKVKGVNFNQILRGMDRRDEISADGNEQQFDMNPIVTRDAANVERFNRIERRLDEIERGGTGGAERKGRAHKHAAGGANKREDEDIVYRNNPMGRRGR